MVLGQRLRAEAMKRVAVIAAVQAELAPLVRRWTFQPQGKVKLWTGGIGGVPCVAACAGMGSVAAAAALAAAERTGSIDAIISYGYAGALSPEVVPGTALALAGAIDAATGARFPAALPPGATRSRRSEGRPAGPSWCVTGSRVAGVEEKAELGLLPGAAVVDMEAAGLGRLAEERGIPFYCFKGVTDGWDQALPDFSGFIGPDGQFAQGRFTLHALLRPWLWLTLVRLAAASRRASLELSRLVSESFLS